MQSLPVACECLMAIGMATRDGGSPLRCAALRHRADVVRAWPDQFAQCLLFQRVRFYPDVPEHEAVTDILLPLR